MRKPKAERIEALKAKLTKRKKIKEQISESIKDTSKLTKAELVDLVNRLAGME